MRNDQTVLMALSGFQGADPLPPVLVAQNIADGKILKVWEITSSRCMTAAFEDAASKPHSPRDIAEKINQMFERNADSNGCLKQFASANNQACLTYVRQFRAHSNTVVGTVRTNIVGKVTYMFERHKVQIRKQFVTIDGIEKTMVKIGTVMTHSCDDCVQLAVEIQLQSENDLVEDACPFDLPSAGACAIVIQDFLVSVTLTHMHVHSAREMQKR